MNDALTPEQSRELTRRIEAELQRPPATADIGDVVAITRRLVEGKAQQQAQVPFRADGRVQWDETDMVLIIRVLETLRARDAEVTSRA